MFGSYELIGTQCFRKFEKVFDQLICNGRWETFRYHSHGFVYSFMIACTYISYKIIALLFEVTCLTLVHMYVVKTLLTCLIKWRYIVFILVGENYVWTIWYLLFSDFARTYSICSQFTNSKVISAWMDVWYVIC